MLSYNIIYIIYLIMQYHDYRISMSMYIFMASLDAPFLSSMLTKEHVDQLLHITLHYATLLPHLVMLHLLVFDQGHPGSSMGTMWKFPMGVPQ